MVKATAEAGANIALVKYWGNRGGELNLPLNNSISLTLDKLRVRTTVDFRPDFVEDVVVINGETIEGQARRRIVAHLDRVRDLAGVGLKARVESSSTFPAGAGLASSASGFAALTLAATAALGMELSDRELSTLARLGSGSASRSVLGGYVEWIAGEDHETSYAISLASAEHWDLKDVVVIVAEGHKEVTSAQGHRLAATSPFLQARLAELTEVIPKVRQAILERDLATLGPLIEHEALSMHAVMMTSRPSLIYWWPETVRVMQEVRQWREEGLEVYFTIDAGPNLHLMVEPGQMEGLTAKLAEVEGVKRCIVCGPGEGVRLVVDQGPTKRA